MVVDILHRFLFIRDYKNTILVQSDYLVYGIVIAYIIFVKFLGPYLMKRREAFDLYYFVILFNAALVIWNGYLSFTVGQIALNFWNSRCSIKHDPHFKEYLKVFGYIAWQGLLIKTTELIDTVIFVLRKKFNQITFLHVLHHSVVLLLYWIILKRNEIAYYLLLTASINCGVHVFTYLYYGLSAIGPGVRKYLWWKKYLTTLQILQFFVLLVYFIYSVLAGCGELDVTEKTSFVFCFVICVLFLNFYIKTYCSKGKSL